MKTSNVPYATLRQLLLDLGFDETIIPGSHILWRHDPSDTLFMFRLYRPQDHITMVCLLSTRKHLDEGGLLSAESFDARLRQALA
jgi:hypothetical protein